MFIILVYLCPIPSTFFIIYSSTNLMYCLLLPIAHPPVVFLPPIPSAYLYICILAEFQGTYLSSRLLTTMTFWKFLRDPLVASLYTYVYLILVLSLFDNCFKLVLGCIDYISFIPVSVTKCLQFK